MRKNLQLANKEPLFHMVKRDTISIKKAWGILKWTLYSRHSKKEYLSI